MIEIKGLSKKFQSANGEITALRDIDLTINDGEIFGIIGLSGAGKSTLVRCMNLLERPTSGNVFVDGRDLTEMSKKELLATRRNIGMIFQGFNLLEQRNVIGNIMFPMEIAGIPKDRARSRVNELLEIVGLTSRAHSFPSQLSGGQKQRVAIARALATEPKYLLCDEATSALDPTTTEQILELLRKINREQGVTVIIITHEMRVIEQICDRVAVLDKSRIVELGSVSEVFANPQSEMGRELVLPKSSAVPTELSGSALRITFDGRSSFEPVISNMILECRCNINILYADTKDIGGRAVGQMLIQLPEDEKAVVRIKSFLDSRSILYREESV
ncbi:MAG: ATP-binding cassette domain-containing protein [Clostridia bacterium]|nr:ATP-binding cassette domain-containing protein [Clostridia bacterium]